MRFLPLVASSSPSALSSNSLDVIRFSMTTRDSTLQPRTGGNFSWKFLDTWELNLFVTAWTLHQTKVKNDQGVLFIRKQQMEGFFLPFSKMAQGGKKINQLLSAPGELLKENGNYQIWKVTVPVPCKTLCSHLTSFITDVSSQRRLSGATDHTRRAVIKFLVTCSLTLHTHSKFVTLWVNSINDRQFHLQHQGKIKHTQP